MPLTNPPHRLCSQLLTTSRASLASTSIPYSNSSLAITSILLRAGLVSNLTLGTPTHPSPTEFIALPPPAKRIWVGLKHRNGHPVLRQIGLVSKPSLRVMVTKEELGRLLTGKRARNVQGVGMGEILVIKVPREKDGRTGMETYLEGWEAWRAGLGGEVVCRAR
ncbi:hypothetical protein P7C73_g4970, partial [Tremellales sp. Uapishka_1]